LGDNAEQVLSEIDGALLRIDDGTYGTCSNCGSEIPRERLEVNPWASLCIDCKRKAEGG
jgi:DnaK suppressor protein